MKRSSRLFLFAFSLFGSAGWATGALLLDTERDAALERARAEQTLVLSERTARMLGHLHEVPEVVLVHGTQEER